MHSRRLRLCNSLSLTHLNFLDHLVFFFLIQLHYHCYCGLSCHIVNGGWGEWGAWSECAQTCGDGEYRTRIQQCNNPAPKNGGQYCSGRGAEAQDCGDLPPCPTEAPGSGDCGDDEDSICEVWYVVALVLAIFVHNDHDDINKYTRPVIFCLIVHYYCLAASLLTIWNITTA